MTRLKAYVSLILKLHRENRLHGQNIERVMQDASDFIFNHTFLVTFTYLRNIGLNLTNTKQLAKIKYILSNLKQEIVFDGSDERSHANIKSYSQEGEDIIVRELITDKKIGTYVDVGAHHPFRFSNTQMFFAIGWNGINIDPNEKAISEFKIARPKDINLQVGISDIEGELDFYKFSDSALNTFNKERKDELVTNSKYELIETIKVPVRKLQDVIDEYGVKSIDLLNIDVEEYEEHVIASLDFDKNPPGIIIIEQARQSIQEILNGEVYNDLNERGYRLIARTNRSSVYQHSHIK